MAILPSKPFMTTCDLRPSARLQLLDVGRLLASDLRGKVAIGGLLRLPLATAFGAQPGALAS